jgi:hypothetical protein
MPAAPPEEPDRSNTFEGMLQRWKVLSLPLLLLADIVAKVFCMINREICWL